MNSWLFFWFLSLPIDTLLGNTVIATTFPGRDECSERTDKSSPWDAWPSGYRDFPGGFDAIH